VILARIRAINFLLRGAGYPKSKAIWLALVAVWKVRVCEMVNNDNEHALAVNAASAT